MKVAIFFNTPSLGGAERSMIHQSNLLPHAWEVVYFLPYLNDSNECCSLQTFIKESSLKSDKIKIRYFQYPNELYQKSRSGSGNSFINMLLGLWQILLNMRALNLFSYDLIWLNGNKIGFPVYLYLRLMKFTGDIYWHYRDYPALNFPYNLIWQLFKSDKCNLTLIGNSSSVCKALENIRGNAKVARLYNPSGEKLVFKPWDENKKTYSIGIVSMFAPWKGLHLALSYHLFYAQELYDLGVRELKIFGGNIYHTKGEHAEYYEQLNSLISHFKNLPITITFMGNSIPDKIFSEIDILFHCSVKPEPFGRVILESFLSGVPVISFGLGGSFELLDGGAGFIITPDHPYEFLATIKLLVEKSRNTSSIVGEAYRKGQAIDNVAINDLQLLLQSSELP